MATNPQAGKVRVLGLIVLIIGAVMIVAGVATYAVVSYTLGEQNITVASDASHFAGQHVTQPWQAYVQADTIAKHAEEIAGGKTYAELPQDDPNRNTVMIASFLQASLFTSVVAFGVAVMAVGVGVVMVLIGVAVRWLARREPHVDPLPTADQIPYGGSPAEPESAPTDEDPAPQPAQPAH